MAWTAQTYLERMERTRKNHLKNIDVTGKSIVGIYQRAAKDLAAKAASAKTGGLTERWALDYQKALERRMAQLREELGTTIKRGMQASARLPGAAIEDWLDDALRMIGVDGSFTGTLSRAPDEALRALLDGRMYRDGKSLSRRIWSQTAQLQGDIEEIVAQGIAQHRSALELARDLGDYVNPKARVPVSWHKIYPDIPFDRKIDYNAQRLARTAINQSYWAAQIETAKANPFCKAIHWQLSPSHYERQVARFGEDVCDTYAAHDEGLGIGNWRIDRAPMPHAQCLCATWQVVPELDDVADRLSRWVDGGRDSELDKAFGAWRAASGKPVKSANTINAAFASNPISGTIKVDDIKTYFPSGTNNWMQPKYHRDGRAYTTPSGKHIIYPRKYDKKKQQIYPDQMIEIVEKLPDKLKQVLPDVFCVDYYNPQDAYWRKTYKNFTRSFATGGKDSISFYRNDNANTSDEAVRNALVHEVGHVLDQSNGWISASAEYQNAIAADKLNNGVDAPTTYATNSVREDFAESVMLFIADENAFASKFPSRAAVLRRVLK